MQSGMNERNGFRVELPGESAGSDLSVEYVALRCLVALERFDIPWSEIFFNLPLPIVSRTAEVGEPASASDRVTGRVLVIFVDIGVARMRIDLYVWIDRKTTRVQGWLFNDLHLHHVATLCEMLGIDGSAGAR